MNKQTHTKFNLNNFLMAFSSALDNTVANNKNDVKYSSKALAYISIKLAKQLDINANDISDIFSYSIICKNDTFLQNISSVPFNSKNFLEDKTIAVIVNIAIFIISNIKLQNNIIINENELKNSLKQNNTIPKDILNAFLKITKKESFWYDLCSPQIAFYIFNDLDDFTQELLLDDLIQFTAIVHDSVYNYTKRNYENSCIDFKAYELCNYFEFENKDKARFIIASHLHNIGLLFISQYILNKPAKLNNSEFQIIKSAPYHTNSILQQVFGFDDIAKLCTKYMEKPNGSGYPNNLLAEHLSLKDRMLSTLCAYQALSEKRIYRDSFNKEDIISTLQDENFDEQIIKILINLK